MINSKNKEIFSIIESAISAADPQKAIKEIVHLQKNRLTIEKNIYNLDLYENIYVIGAGKAVCSMAISVEEILGDRIAKGIIVTKYGHKKNLSRIEVIEAGHPIPDENGAKGVKRIIELFKGIKRGDLIIILLSGGASSLLPAPNENISLNDKKIVTELLLKSGAAIDEINAVRKHISRIKGGQLASLIYPSEAVCLILSDVIGDRLDVIASGPTVPDNSTFKDAIDILKNYSIWNNTPRPVINYLLKGMKGDIAETPKAGNPAFKRISNIIIGNNKSAVASAEKKAKELGYHTMVLSTFIEGEAREIGKLFGAIAKEIDSFERPLKRKACIIAGGETTVTVKGKGKGGRAQEFALSAALMINGLKDAAIVGVGTDGTDGPTDAAGAIADSTTVKRANEKGLDIKVYLENNDSYSLFKKLNDLIITGPTNTNVNDLYMAFVF